MSNLPVRISSEEGNRDRAKGKVKEKEDREKEKEKEGIYDYHSNVCHSS